MNRGVELASWKDIADYLQVDVRTAQRWETERGLPVRRSNGNTVTARRADLDRWRESALQERSLWSNPRALRIYCLALGAALAAAALLPPVLKVAERLRAEPSGLRWEGATLLVSDDRGRDLWRQTFSAPPLRTSWLPLPCRTWIRSGEVLVMYEDWLACFSARGRRRWQFQSVWPLHRFRVTPEGNAVAVAVDPAAEQAAASLLDHNGQPLAEYRFPSSSTAQNLVEVFADEIWLGGFDPALGRATVTVLDARLREKAVVRFPRTPTNQQKERFNLAYDLLALPNGTVKVQVRERFGEPNPFVLYVLDRSLAVRDIDVSWTMRTWFHDFTAAELAALARQVEVIQSPGPPAAALATPPAPAPRSPE